MDLFAGHLFIDFCLEISMFGTSKSLFSHGKYGKKRLFMEFVFKEFLDQLLVFFKWLGNRFSDFLRFENKLENETIFSEKPDLEKWIWWCRSQGIRAL